MTPSESSMAEQDGQLSRMRVRPMFAAIVFGFFALVFLSAAIFILIFARDAAHVVPGISLLCPCATLAYFAMQARTQQHRSALQAFPQRACGMAAASFGAIAIVALGWNGVGAAVGPALAALLFALCLDDVRRVLSILACW